MNFEKILILQRIFKMGILKNFDLNLQNFCEILKYFKKFKQY